MHHLLNVLLWLPLVGGVFILLICDDTTPHLPKYIGLFTVLLTLLLCVPLVRGFNLQSYTMQYVEHYVWLPAFGINYDLGIDGISLLMIVLSIFTTLIVICATWNSINTKISQYMAAFL